MTATALVARKSDFVLSGPIGSFDAYMDKVSRIPVLSREDETVLAARFVDRIGKGIRGAPRDALLADLESREVLMGKLAGAMLASLLIGVVTSLAVGVDRSMADLLAFVGAREWADSVGGLLTLKVSSLAATIPFALMLLVLLVRPRGLMGEEG